MPDSTLSKRRDDFRGAVGFFLGFGRGADTFNETAWTTDQARTIDIILTSGLAQFYNPPVLPGERDSYNWSFLKPTVSFTLPAGGNSLALPDDFGGLENRIICSSSSSRPYIPVQVVNDGTVLLKQAQYPDSQGQPLAAGITWNKQVSQTGGQRATLLLWPKADQAYTLQLQYYFLPEALSGNWPNAYGGAQHSETILASCRYAAERDLDDVMDGPCRAYFMERLAVSVSLDRKFKPQQMGRNVDRSDDLDQRYDRRLVYENESATTFAGQLSN